MCPGTKYGYYIKCEKSIVVYLEILNKTKNFIEVKLDDNNLLIKESEIEYVKKEINDLLDKNYKESEL
jgi:hypothetical protein